MSRALYWAQVAGTGRTPREADVLPLTGGIWAARADTGTYLVRGEEGSVAGARVLDFDAERIGKRELVPADVPVTWRPQR